jgi:hypothetical protein
MATDDELDEGAALLARLRATKWQDQQLLDKVMTEYEALISNHRVLKANCKDLQTKCDQHERATYLSRQAPELFRSPPQDLGPAVPERAGDTPKPHQARARLGGDAFSAARNADPAKAPRERNAPSMSPQKYSPFKRSTEPRSRALDEDWGRGNAGDEREPPHSPQMSCLVQDLPQDRRVGEIPVNKDGKRLDQFLPLISTALKKDHKQFTDLQHICTGYQLFGFCPKGSLELCRFNHSTLPH